MLELNESELTAMGRVGVKIGNRLAALNVAPRQAHPCLSTCVYGWAGEIVGVSYRGIRVQIDSTTDCPHCRQIPRQGLPNLGDTIDVRWSDILIGEAPPMGNAPIHVRP